jgi:hypothetical protein
MSLCDSPLRFSPVRPGHRYTLRRDEQGSHVVTEANMFELAEWCRGTVVLSPQTVPYIELPYPGVHARVGDVIKRVGEVWGVDHHPPAAY